MTDVFISYSRKDKEFIERLHAALEKDGRDIWVDWEDIPLTSDWWAEIRRGIEEADTFIFVMTPNSLSSAVCNLEVAHAAQHNKRIVPVVHVDTNADEAMKQIAAIQPDSVLSRMLGEQDLNDVAHENWTHLGHINWVFLRETDDFDSAFQGLLDIINTDLTYVRNHTRILVRANDWENNNRAAGFLLKGEELRDAQNWLAQAGEKEPEPTARHTEFILESGKNESSQQRRIMIGVSIALVIAVGLAILSSFLFVDAQNARSVAEDERDKASTQQVVAENNAVTATIAQGQAEIQADNAATQAAIADQQRDIAENNAVTATIAQGQAEIQADNAATQAAIADQQRDIAENNAVTATIAQGQAEIQADNAATQAAIADEQRDIAERQAAESQSLAIAAQAEIVQDSDQAIAMALALHAVEIDNPPAFARERLASIGFAPGPVGFVYIPADEYIYSVNTSLDGQLVFVGDDGGAVYIYNLNEDAEPLHTLEEHDGTIWDIAVNPNGESFISASADGSLILWDIETGEALRYFEEHDNEVTGVAFTSDGERVISSSFDDTLIVWDVATGEVINRITGFDEGFLSLAINPDDTVVLGGSWDGLIGAWDIETGELLETYAEHLDAVSALVFLANGNFVSSSYDSSVIFWDIENDDLFDFVGHQLPVNALAVSSDGTRILSGSIDQSIILWDVETTSMIHQFRGHTDWVQDIAIYPDGNFAVSGGDDSRLFVWDFNNHERLKTFRDLEDFIPYVTFNSDGKALVSSEAEGIYLWNPETDEIELEMYPETDLTFISIYSPDEKTILSGHADPNLMILWDAETGEMIRQFDEEHYDWIRSISISPDGQHALSTADDGRIIRWDMNTGKMIDEFELPDYDDIGETSRVLYLADGNAIFGTTWGWLFHWDMENNREIRSFDEHWDYITDLILSDDGTMFLSASGDKTLILWDVETGEMVQEFLGHDDVIRGADLSADSRYVLSGAHDNSVILWDVATGEAIRRFSGHVAPVLDVAFNPDGLIGVSSAEDMTVIVWNIEAVVAPLSEQIEWICENRMVWDLDDEERAGYGVTSDNYPCD